jgi:hypothetical protein
MPSIAMPDRPQLVLPPGSVALADLRRIYRGEVSLAMNDGVDAQVEAARDALPEPLTAMFTEPCGPMITKPPVSMPHAYG